MLYVVIAVGAYLLLRGRGSVGSDAGTQDVGFGDAPGMQISNVLPPAQASHAPGAGEAPPPKPLRVPATFGAPKHRAALASASSRDAINPRHGFGDPTL